MPNSNSVTFQIDAITALLHFPMEYFSLNTSHVPMCRGLISYFSMEIQRKAIQDKQFFIAKQNIMILNIFIVRLKGQRKHIVFQKTWFFA